MVVHIYNPSPLIPGFGRLRQEFEGSLSHIVRPCIKKNKVARHQWLTPVILAAQEAEIKRITVQSQPSQIVHETLSQKKSITKKGWWSDSRFRP
jgi:hypothetical protein